jgi:hypothetical protein
MQHRTLKGAVAGPVYYNEKGNCRLTNKEICVNVKKKNPTITETIRLNRLCWFGHIQRVEEKKIILLLTRITSFHVYVLEQYDICMI